MRETPFPMEEFAPEFRLQRLDRAGERRLRNAAILRRPREVERPGHGEKVSNLMHFHGMTLPNTFADAASAKDRGTGR